MWRLQMPQHRSLSRPPTSLSRVRAQGEKSEGPLQPSLHRKQSTDRAPSLSSSRTPAKTQAPMGEFSDASLCTIPTRYAGAMLALSRRRARVPSHQALAGSRGTLREPKTKLFRRAIRRRGNWSDRNDFFTDQAGPPSVRPDESYTAGYHNPSHAQTPPRATRCPRVSRHLAQQMP